jgi:hypothetical protein
MSQCIPSTAIIIKKKEVLNSNPSPTRKREREEIKKGGGELKNS